MNPILKFALGLANVPDATVADLEKAFPGMQRLCAAAKQIEAVAQKSQPLEAHIEQIEPIIKAAYPDFVAVLPTVEELIQFASQKGI